MARSNSPFKTFRVVALDGVAKRLPLHAGGSRRLADGHSPKRVSNPQHAPAGAVVLLRPRKSQQPFPTVKIVSNFRPAPP